MGALEDVRQEVMTAVIAAHNSNYPAVKLNPPNYAVVDVERQKEPFVAVELDLSPLERAALGEREMRISARVDVIYYYRDGIGTSEAWQYADAMNDTIGMRQIGALLFYPVNPVPIQTFPGWKGLMCGFKFDVVPELSC